VTKLGLRISNTAFVRPPCCFTSYHFQIYWTGLKFI